METRTCKKCKIDQELKEFRVMKRLGKFYISWTCFSCERRYSNNYRMNNPDKCKERQKISRERNKAHYQEYNSVYYQTHPEYRDKIRSRYLEYRKTEEGKLKHKIRQNNRRAKQKNNGGVVSDVEWKETLDFYGNRCISCGRDNVKLTIDHIIPIKLGGKHSIENIQPLCQSCNSKKHTKIIDYRNNSLYEGVAQ